MNRTRAIWLKCLDCGGSSPKEVTLCQIVACSLWTYRFGYFFNTERYKKRMAIAKRKYPEEYKVMIKLLKDHLKNMPNSSEKAQIQALLKDNGEIE